MDAASPTSESPPPADPERVRDHLLAGGVAALPTDTVPGLAVLATSEGAAARLAAVKGAPLDRPFSLHLRSLQELRSLVPEPPPGLAGWLDQMLPGPLTVVLPRAWVELPPELDWPWPQVGLRLPQQQEYLRLMERLEGPLFMTSINPHGVAPLQGQALVDWLQNRPQIVLGFDPAQVEAAVASAVLGFNPQPSVLRGDLPAACPPPGLRVLCLCTGNTCRSPLAAALLKRELATAWGVSEAELGQLGWHIASAGIGAHAGAPASEHALEVAAAEGLDLSHHRSQNASLAFAKPWDLVLAMGYHHLAPMPEQLQAELFAPDQSEIPDPYGQSLMVYRQTIEHLQEVARQRVQMWREWPPG
jgi:tRNA threonylcarbamoyl adenosine modification protein (Sua5/YciO/YrdC/YwlC family)